MISAAWTQNCIANLFDIFAGSFVSPCGLGPNQVTGGCAHVVSHGVASEATARKARAMFRGRSRDDNGDNGDDDDDDNHDEDDDDDEEDDEEDAQAAGGAEDETPAQRAARLEAKADAAAAKALRREFEAFLVARGDLEEGESVEVSYAHWWCAKESKGAC